MGWGVAPAPRRLPLLRRSKCRVPPWVLSSMILLRLKTLLEMTTESRRAPRGSVQWTGYSNRSLPRTPSRFPVRSRICATTGESRAQSVTPSSANSARPAARGNANRAVRQRAAGDRVDRPRARTGRSERSGRHTFLPGSGPAGKFARGASARPFLHGRGNHRILARKGRWFRTCRSSRQRRHALWTPDTNCRCG
jgi:hypothetical protein